MRYDKGTCMEKCIYSTILFEQFPSEPGKGSHPRYLNKNSTCMWAYLAHFLDISNSQPVKYTMIHSRFRGWISFMDSSVYLPSGHSQISQIPLLAPAYTGTFFYIPGYLCLAPHPI